MNENSTVKWDGTSLTGLVYGIAAPRGYVAEQLLRGMNAHKPLDSGMSVSIELLHQQRIDGIVIPDIIAELQIAASNRTDIVPLTPPFYRQPIYMAFSTHSALSSAQRQQIWAKLATSKAVIDSR